MPDTGRYGRVEVGENGRIVRFIEKDAAGVSGIVSAGVYFLEREMVEHIQRMSGSSLERDIFAALPPKTLYAFTGECLFIDIGTAEGLADAQRHVKPTRSPDPTFLGTLDKR